MKNIDVENLLELVASDDTLYDYFDKYRTAEYRDCPKSFRMLMSAVEVKRPLAMMEMIDKHRRKGDGEAQ